MGRSIILLLLVLGGCVARSATVAPGYGALREVATNFEVEFSEQEDARARGVPYFGVGSGELPAEWGSHNYTRITPGYKVRYYAVPFAFVEGGFQVSYYDSPGIDTPWELEGQLGLGTVFEVSERSRLLAAVSVRRGLGNGDDHEHAGEFEHFPAGWHATASVVFTFDF